MTHKLLVTKPIPAPGPDMLHDAGRATVPRRARMPAMAAGNATGPAGP